ncbi:MAG: propionate kinase [Spirochaetes bacterium GWD1_61_31]|nr:MAG: propionate kinase [Spirochaetes bacterium GWB1_60_80]OHD35272.1 MAG: propionate kinase [Spirochaetes bacterium GWC1_61_12]OHD36027.1 MAG: propionate kinase [Spirochaetes bacterium GWD1_61_31]OHD42224.1 MAG: propionate kinase [Spirochaetes bacterium GWE1_60_18]OHD57970.1 MAG: propionate kinase [Spirochaetes bacterium GWF1_60_12]HAP44397.1 propionate kinase [Spirochaetaceae bacterium]
MVILTLNCGSSSVKYQVYDWTNKDVLASGIVERVTLGDSTITHKPTGKSEHQTEHDCPTHTVAIQLILDTLVHSEYGVIKDMSVIKAVGHRMVHGGSKFARSCLINDDFLATFRELSDLAPLHNPANLTGVEAARSVLPNVPHCATMDTAWHQTMPATSYSYALPHEWEEKFMVRRYGFHGTSFLYNAKRAAALLGKDPFKTNLIIAHIGNGSSINAVKDGCSFDTSMGLTPMEGLVMGTRCGDIDPGIIFHLIRKAGLSAADVEKKLNKESGVLGITGRWSDRRDIENAAEKGDPVAILAQEVESYRIKKYIGAYSAALGRVDALVFTAGVGEMGPITRQLATSGLENLGIIIDQEKNAKAKCRNAELEISTPESTVKVFVIPTDEELVMTEDAFALMQGTYDVHTKYTYQFESPAYVNKQRAAGLEKDLAKKPYLAGLIAHPVSKK